MKNVDLWNGLDRLAARKGFTASGLARQAGLDATAFNKSKRIAADGKPRWLSMESLARVLDVTGATLDDFAVLADPKTAGRTIPVIGFAKAGQDGYFDDDGFPIGEKWDDVRFPGLGPEAGYALEVAGDSMLPAYRPGDRIIVGPGVEPHRGDRAVIRLADGEVVAKEIGRISARQVELISLNAAYTPRQVARAEIAWMSRILWVSQ